MPHFKPAGLAELAEWLRWFPPAVMLDGGDGRLGLEFLRRCDRLITHRRIDISKMETSVREGVRALNDSLVTMPTLAAETRKIWATIIEHSPVDRPDVVIFEACTMAGWVYDLCQSLGLRTKVANTTSEAWKFKNLKRKTDRDDAERLARLEAMGELPEVRVPSATVRERRALIAFRQSLIGRRVAVQNQIRAVFVGQGLSIPSAQKAWTLAGVSELRSHARALSDCVPGQLWRGQLFELLEELDGLWQRLEAVEKKLDQLAKADPATQLLETAAGIGRRTAEVVAVYIDDPKRFSNGREVSAYSGLVPRQYQSGELDRRGRITRRGPSVLRKLLVEAAWCMLRYNAWAREIVARISRGQRSRKKQAIIALARKVLVRLWAMLRDGTPWRDDPMATRSRERVAMN